MAENLRKLVSSETLRLMHDKLDGWLREYNVSPRGQPRARRRFSSWHSPRRAGSGRSLGKARAGVMSHQDRVSNRDRRGGRKGTGLRVQFSPPRQGALNGGTELAERGLRARAERAPSALR